MFKNPLLILALCTACCAAQAQSSSAKKELVARILKAQQPAIEAMARGLAEEPALRLLQRASQALPQRVAADKQQAVAQEIESDAKKYVDETVPLVRDRALKLAPVTIGTMLEEKFSEDELKQVVAALESPAFVKFQQAGGELQKALLEKVVAEMRPAVEPKVKALELTIAKRLGVTPPGDAAKGPAKPAAKK